MIANVAGAVAETFAQIAPRTRSTPGAVAVAATGAPEPGLRVAVHDRSRVEWVATVPIAPIGDDHTWDITFDIMVPDAIWLAHSPWDHFTVRSRLMSPVLLPSHRQVGLPIEQLRRLALAAAHELKQATEAIGGQLLAVRKRDRLLTDGEADE